MIADILEEEFKEAFIEFEYKRQEHLCQKFENTEAYLNFSTKSEELCQRIAEILPAKHKMILNEYTDVFMDMLAEYQMFFYKHGLMDSSRMLEILLGESKCINLNISATAKTP